MGRMFRIITEATEPQAVLRQAVPPGPESVAEFTPHPPEVPFVEIGGPEGMISSEQTSAVDESNQIHRNFPSSATTTVNKHAPTSESPEDETTPTECPEAEATPPAIGTVVSVALHHFDQGSYPAISPGLSDELITVYHPRHPVSREYTEIWQQIRDTYLESAPRQLLLTAAVPASGTSIVTANLAVVAARESERKVLIIDGNFLRPGLARRFGVEESPGLADVLDQSVPLAWAIQSTSIPQLQALTAGRRRPQRPASLAEIPKLLSQLRHWYAWIFVDAGVWSESIAGEVLAAASDGTYFVTRSDRVSDPEFLQLRGIVSDAGGHPRGYISTTK